MVRIRRADCGDVEQVAVLFDAYRRFYRQRPALSAARRYLRDRLRRRDSVIFVALANGVGVGFVQLYPSWDSVVMRPLWILSDLYVVPGSRRAGVGRALLERARRHAARLGAVKLVLETATDNRAAQRLYRQLGWQRDTEFERFWLEP